MNFSGPPRKPPAENLLPMINVVFLLLIFFLISARLTPPEPLPVDPPVANTEAEATGNFTLYLGADGMIGYRDSRDDAAIAELASVRNEYCAVVDCVATPPLLSLRADGTLPARLLAGVMPKLQAQGFANIELVAKLGTGQ